MTNTVTLEQVEQLVTQLPAQEQLKLVAHAGERLSEQMPMILQREVTEKEQLQQERLTRAEAILALCDAAAERLKGESNAVEDIRRIHDERIEQICQSGA